MTVFLYSIKRKVELTLRETNGTANWNLPMNTNDFKVFKDVSNTIEFIVRDTDRRPIDLTGRKLAIQFYDQRTNKEVWKAPLLILNAIKGLCKVEIPPHVTSDWFLQSYRYQVLIVNQDSTTHFLYVAANEYQYGYFELCQGPAFEPLSSTVILAEHLTPNSNQDNQVNDRLLFSSALKGSSQTHNVNGVHTVLAYLENFTGHLLIQGSVETGTPTEQDWYDVRKVTYDHQSGMDGMSFEANLNWVRFVVFNHYTQDVQPLLVNQGKITKLVFRN